MYIQNATNRKIEKEKQTITFDKQKIIVYVDVSGGCL